MIVKTASQLLKADYTSDSLLDFLMATEKSCFVKTIVLLVNEVWGSAIHIYKNAGFKTINIFPQNFPPEKDSSWTAGILMDLQFK